jgi:hypothetical protein
MTTTETVLLAGDAITLTFLYLTRRRDPDDVAAGVALGPDSQLSTPPLSTPAPLPDLIATQCAQCRHVRTTDQRWLPPAMVPLPPGCRVSHGYCPTCARLAQLELDRAYPMPARQPLAA